ncbi:transposase [Rhizobium sp. SORGH_AS 787]|nr:transposase [Rhizobium sp. SORGH_AS_0787]
MIFPSNRVRIMVATKPVDFRKGHDGLAALVKNELHKDPFTGTVFVFRSLKADRLKLIYWDGSGIVMAYKRLEEHTFTWPSVKDGLITLTHPQSKPCVGASTGGGFTPSRRERRRPSNSCGTMTQHDRFQRQIGAGFGSFRPCLMPPNFPTMLSPCRRC